MEHPLSQQSGPKFPLGRIVATPGVLSALAPEEIQTALGRHLVGDWGELDQEDRRENELSLAKGFRLLSAYTSKVGIRFWIITEANRSVTTILLPEEY